VDVFVGRERELEELRGALEQTHGGRGALFMISGEPGVGKTTIVDTLFAEAREQDALSAWGRCWEGGGAPAYWPWVQVIRSYARAMEPEQLAARLGAGAAHVAKIVPDLAELVGDLDEPAALDPDRARFALFDAVAGFLRATSEDTPLVIALDDLHAADQPSLLLLQFVARELSTQAVLILCTYREVEVRLDPQVAKLIADIARAGRRIPLRGLSEQYVERFIEAAAGSAPSRTIVRAVHEATEGNPFFMDEVVRLLTATGRLDAEAIPSGVEIPDEVRDAVRQRLDPLPARARDVLGVASVFGREFSMAALQHIASESRDELVEIVDDAAERGLVAPLAGTIERHSFTHALISETLYTDLPPSRRAQLHRQAGEALEALHAGDIEAHLAELAHHFYSAAAIGNPGKAIQYSVAAGDRCMALLAFEEAAGHYEHALQAFGLEERADVPRRCDLLLALGEAQNRAGDSRNARETLQRAFGLARKLDAPERLGRAALAYGAGLGGFEFGRVDEVLVGLLREARAALEGSDSALLARVTGRLAVELYFSASEGDRAEMSAQAVEIARRVGDAGALASVLSARHLALWGPENLGERLDAASEVVRLGGSEGDRELALRGRVWRLADQMERGDVTAADGDLDLLMSHADELHDPLYLWYVPLYRGMRATLEGRFEDGEQLAAEALEVGRHARAGNAEWLYAIQLLALRRDQGRLEEVEPQLTGFVERYPATPHWRTGLAYMYAELGRTADAAVELDAAAVDDFAGLPRDGEWLSAMGMLAEAAALAGQVGHAERLLGLIEPFADRNVMAGRGAASFGPMARYCGMVSALLERHDDADRHFAAAEELALQMRALPAVARTRCDWAGALIRRGESDRARPLLTAALETALELGMRAVELRAEELNAELSDPPHGARGAASAVSVAHLLNEGEIWTLSYGDAAFRLKDSKGLHHIARLIASPGQEFHATELVAGPGERAASGAAAHAREANPDAAPGDLGDAGALLDPQAKAEYRSRLAELREELEESESFNDPERAARAREEMDFVTRELAGAVGLGGRDRKASSAAERARVNATRAIKGAIERIAANDPALGRHLGAAIRTGTFCRYEPDPSSTIAWSAEP
jgi:AAA ATPase-like protein